MEKIDALLEPSAMRPLGAGLGSAAGSMAHELQPSTLARLQSLVANQDISGDMAHSQARMTPAEVAAQHQASPRTQAQGAGPVHYRAPPSIGDIQATFKIEARGNGHLPSGAAMRSEHSSVKPSIPGLAVQELGQVQSFHA